MSNAGRMIKDARSKKGFNQKVIAKYLGMTDAFLGQIELGHQQLPPRHALKLADKLNLRLHDLVDAMKHDHLEVFKRKIKKFIG